MKKINFIKIALDTEMAIVFALLFNKMVLGGIVFHEVAGTAIGAAFIIHMALNWRWVKQVTLKIFSSKLSIKTRIGYIVNVLLLVTMSFTIISGIAISKSLFVNLKFGNTIFFKVAHTSVPYLALILIGIHLGLHWTWVMNMFKRVFKITAGKKSLNYISKACVILVFAFGIYCISSSNFISRVSSSNRIFSTSQFPAGDRGLKQPQNGEGKSGIEREGNFQKRQAPDGMSRGQAPNRADGRLEGMPGGKGISTNPINVVTTNLGIISVFAAITYYIEKILMILRAKKNSVKA
jgi:hypothetical protein